MDISSLLQALPLLLKTVPAAKAGMKGVDLSAQKETANELKQITGAETDMSNPLFQSMLSQNKQAGQSQLASTIAQLQAQNRLAQSSGQKPLLDQERGGESIFRNLVQGQQDVGNQAVGQTYNQLQGAQSGLTNLYGTQGDLAKAQFGNTVKKVGAYGSMSDALQGLFGLNKNQSATTTAYNPTQYIAPKQPVSLLPQNYGSQATGGY